MEGFDYEGSTYQIQQGIALPDFMAGTYSNDFKGFSCYIASTSSRWGTGSYAVIQNGPGPGSPNVWGFVLPLSETVTSGYFGAAIQIINDTTAYLGFYDIEEKIMQFSVQISAIGSVTIQIGNLNSTTVTSILARPFAAGWNYISVYGLTGSSGAITVYVNGTQVYSETGLTITANQNVWGNPVSTNSGNISGIMFGNLNYNYGSVYVDDVYFNSPAGSVNNGFLGDVRISHSTVTANVSTQFNSVGPAGTSWDTTGAVASVNLSNFSFAMNNRTVKISYPYTPSQVCALQYHTTGKYYVEFVFNAAAASSGQIGVGIIPTNYQTSNPSPDIMMSNFSTDAFCFFVSGSEGFMPNVIGTSSTNLGDINTSGFVVALALDLTDKLAWINLGAGWVGSGGTSGNPATGTNGYSISYLSGDLVLCIAQSGSSVSYNSIITMNSSIFYYAIPSGFSAWALPSTANWQNVSAVPPSGDYSYNYSGTVNHEDTFSQSSDYTTQNFYAVQVTNFFREDDGAGHSLESVISSSGTLATGSSVAANASYQYSKEIFETDPATSGTWTAASVNALTIGYKETS